VYVVAVGDDAEPAIGIFEGGRRYRLVFKEFDLSNYGGNSRQVASAAVTDYALELARQVEKEPLNWFNFYSFWQSPST